MGGGAFGVTVAGKSHEDFSISGFIAYSIGAAIGAAIGEQIGNNLDKKWETVALPQLRVGSIPGRVTLGSQFHF